MRKKVGISIGLFQKKFGDKEALRIAKEIGADCVDFSLTDKKRFDLRNENSIYGKSDEEIVAYFTDIRKYAEKIGIEISQTHGKISGLKNIPEEDEALINNIRIDCMATAALGAPICVIHNVTLIHLGVNPDPNLMHSLSFSLFSQAIEFAKQYGVKIATETFGDATNYNVCDFFGNIDQFLMTYNKVKNTKDYGNHFCICVDTGHSNKASLYGNPSPGDVIRMCGNDVKVLHLNDNDKLTDQHKTPCTGTIDWKDVFSALDDIGYSGVYNMELNLKHFGEDFCIEEAAFSIKVMRQLLKTRYGED